MTDDDDDEALRQIRANAAMVVEQFQGLSDLPKFGYDGPSVQWLDGFIERQRVRPEADAEFVDKMVSVLGSYLGECIIRCHGGRWVRDDDGWRVAFDEKNAAYPFAKVRKQFANGSDDGVHSFFKTTLILFRDLRKPGAPVDPPPTTRPAPGVVTRILNRFRGGRDR